MRLLSVLISVLLLSCKTATIYYIVRHAEKEAGTTMMSTTTMTSDVPLSAQGTKRAEALKNELRNKEISAVYSTNTIRTKSTATPLSEAIGIPIQVYDHKDTAFMTAIRRSKGNMLIVGHSNTVDDIVNMLAGKKMLNDLPDSEYGDLFILRKKGNKTTFNRKHFGQP